MIHENTFKPVEFDGAKGLVFLGDKILAYRRDSKTARSPRLVDLPGGGSESGESPFETFQREIQEEFGIRIEKEELKMSCMVPSITKPGMNSYWMVAKTDRFMARDVVFGEEGTEWMLISPEEFISRTDGIQRQQKRVEKYLAGEVISE